MQSVIHVFTIYRAHTPLPTGLKVDVADRFGCSPLYYAALANRPLNAKVRAVMGLIG